MAEPRSNSSAGRWGPERRLAFIEFRLLWDGEMNRSDLVDFFGISPQQASADIQHYKERAPDNITYDRNGKCYIRSEAFSPILVSDRAEAYTDALLGLGTTTGHDGSNWIGSPPPYAVLPSPHRRISPAILRTVVQAICRGDMVEVDYQSMNRPAPTTRWLSPHALGYDGLRWHVRAYSHQHEMFRDYVVARIVKTGDRKASSIDPAADEAWHKTITVRIAPHEQLTDAQKTAIAWEYGMRDGVAEITVRASMVFYLLRMLRLDEDAERRSPKAQQIVLLNPEDMPRGSF
ncbi:WYL domain-containing protein [Salinisphaera hydrothermalis]|uniref:WYL domain-containing protein n=1 Tax=Salinisphaera hydrothermalis TaxID=563188 RepID=UPI000562E691|nr:WYL domain-containing protein [Salinisphaera hydrothermalis]